MNNEEEAMVFDEETAGKLSEFLHTRLEIDFARGFCERLAWEILDNLVTGEWEATND